MPVPAHEPAHEQSEDCDDTGEDDGPCANAGETRASLAHLAERVALAVNTRAAPGSVDHSRSVWYASDSRTR